MKFVQMSALCWRITALIVLLSLFSTINALLSDNFRSFLRVNFGKAYEDLMTRHDLGIGGSFGGGSTPKTINRPIIFVHGITETAGTMERLKQYFLERGYEDNELYATSYGPIGHTTWFDENGKLKCEYVQSIRLMIKAVLAYTGVDKVNVIAYSMGVIISRKAILGGRCVDTRAYLGGPLTTSIRNYIGIAGPNHGAILCKTPLGHVPKPCNLINGMSCGSKYLNDINSKQHYEGEFVYVIQTIPDSIVGNVVCDINFTSRIDGADGTVNTYNQLHVGVFYMSARDQYQLIERHP